MPRKNLHPTFRTKHVMRLDCRSCDNCVCLRGMKAILLADTKVELYSTDWPPVQSVDLVNTPYCTEKCKCKVQDVACLGCGNVIGYTVTQPCHPCLQSCNNGHLWMFHSQAVEASDRLDSSGMQILMWGKLAEEEELIAQQQDEFSEECCR